VLELSDETGAAAACARLFARWGHEVVKVVSPHRAAPEEPAELYLDGGKQRVALDVRRPQDRDQIDRLAAGSDVLITDMAARDVEQLGLLTLGENRRPLVRTSIAPFGLSGPYRDWEATPATLLAHAGHTWLSGDPGRAPLTLPGDYPARHTANLAYVATLAAYMEAASNPEARSQTIEVSTLECLIGLHQFTDTMWSFGQTIRSRHRNRWENIYPSGLFRCSDGWVGLIIQPNFWLPFAQMIGHPEFVEDEHPFADPLIRIEREHELEALINEAFETQPKLTVFREGQETWRVTMGYVASLEEVLADPHLSERRFWRSLDGTAAGAAGDALAVPGSPFRFVGEEPPAESGLLPLVAASELPAREPSADAGPPPDPSRAAPARPLEGIRVLDMTRVWAGPLASRILADLGAEVIKIEAVPPPDGGPGASAPAATRQRMRAAGGKLNRNKKSVAVNLKTEEGRELFLGLVAHSDIVIENFSARVMPGLGLGYERLRKVNDQIIYLPMPAFGNDGPYRDYVGLGPGLEPLTGFTALLGYSDDEPRATAAAIPDAMAGTTAAVALATALERRAREGSGAFIDFSQQEASIAFLGEHFIERQRVGQEPQRLGNAHRTFAPQGVYRCRGDDDWITIAVRDDDDWQALCELSGAGWDGDPRFATPQSRRDHRDELDAALEQWTADQVKTELTQRLQERGVPAAAVFSAPEYLADTHLTERDYFPELDDPETGRHRWDGSPFVIDGDRGYESWITAPGLGQQSAEVLRDLLDLPEAEIASLFERGIVYERPPDG
jgi:crotonobetainyl-CoA:carnitine CoA-transferase CaiB-like acyl-CoA transferase